MNAKENQIEETTEKGIRKDGDATMSDLLNQEIKELTKQKEIEEMARDIPYLTLEKLKEIAKEEYEKALKDKVVLDKEEYESIRKLFTYDKPMLDRIDNFIKEIKEQARQETAKEVLSLYTLSDTFSSFQEKVAKQYGVEVE